MKLPCAGDARVDRTKILEYLLSVTHEDGRGKALFLKEFGFASRNWKVLAECLREHGQNNDVSEVIASEFGKRYVVEGPLKTPDGRNPTLRTVWIIENHNTIPRLITAYPI